MNFMNLWGILQRSPGPLAGFKVPNSKEGEGRGAVGREGEGEGREGEWRRSGLPPTHNFWLRH